MGVFTSIYCVFTQVYKDTMLVAKVFHYLTVLPMAGKGHGGKDTCMRVWW